MIASICLHARTVYVRAQEGAALGASSLTISYIAYVVFGKKALFILACGAYAAFYFRHSFSYNSATLISSVISLPLCGFFLNPVSAIPSTLFLVTYIFKHEYDQKNQIAQLKAVHAEAQQSIKDLNHLIDLIRSNNQALDVLADQEKHVKDIVNQTLQNPSLQEKTAAVQRAYQGLVALTDEVGLLNAEVNRVTVLREKIDGNN
jgi:hypothetical protein